MDAHKSFNVINPFQKGQNRGRRTGKIISKKRLKRNDEMNSFDEYLSESADEQSLIMSQKVVPTIENLQPLACAQMAEISPVIIIQSETQTHISSAHKETQESEVFIKALNPFAGNARYGRRTGKDLLAGKSKLLSNGLANFSDFFSDSDTSLSIHGTPSGINTPTVHSKDVFVKPKIVPANSVHLAQPVYVRSDSRELVSSDMNRSKRNKSPAHGLVQAEPGTNVTATPRNGANKSTNKAVKPTDGASESALGENESDNGANESDDGAKKLYDDGANESDDEANESDDKPNESDDKASETEHQANELDDDGTNKSDHGANETYDKASETEHQANELDDDGTNKSDHGANETYDKASETEHQANELDDDGTNKSDHGANESYDKASETEHQANELDDDGTNKSDHGANETYDKASETEHQANELDDDGTNKSDHGANESYDKASETEHQANELDDDGTNKSDHGANESDDEAKESDDGNYQSVHKAKKSKNKINKSATEAKISANLANQSSNSSKKRTTKSNDFNNSLRRSSGTHWDDANLEPQNNGLNSSKTLNSIRRKSTHNNSKSSVIESHVVNRKDKSLSTYSNLAVSKSSKKANESGDEDKKLVDDGANKADHGANESDDEASETEHQVHQANELDGDVTNKSDHGDNESDGKASETEHQANELDDDGTNKSDHGANESDDGNYQSVHKAKKSKNKINKSATEAKISVNLANQSSNSSKKRTTKSNDFNNFLRRSSGTHWDDANLEPQNNGLNSSKTLNSTRRKSTHNNSKSSVIECHVVNRKDKSLSTYSNLAVSKSSKNVLSDLSKEDKKYKEVEQGTLNVQYTATTNSKNRSKTVIQSSSDLSKAQNKSSRESSSGDQKYKLKETDKQGIVYSDGEKLQSKEASIMMTKQNISRSRNKSPEAFEEPALSKKGKSDKSSSVKDVSTVPEDVNLALEKQNSISVPSTAQDNHDGQAIPHEQDSCANLLTKKKDTEACLNFGGDVAGSLSKTDQAPPSQFFGIKKRLTFSTAITESTRNLKENKAEDFNSFLNEYFHIDSTDLPTKVLSKSISKRSNAQIKTQNLDITQEENDDFLIVDEPLVVNIKNNAKKRESKKRKGQRKSTQKVEEKESNNLIIEEIQSPIKDPEMLSIKPSKRKKAISTNAQDKNEDSQASEEIQSPIKQPKIVSIKPSKRKKAISSNVQDQQADSQAPEEIQSPIKDPEMLPIKPSKRKKAISTNAQDKNEDSQASEEIQSPIKQPKIVSIKPGKRKKAISTNAQDKNEDSQASEEIQSPIKQPKIVSIKPGKRKKAISTNAQDKNEDSQASEEIQSPIKQPKIVSIKPSKRKKAISSNVQDHRNDSLTVKEMKSPINEPKILPIKPSKKKKAISSNVQDHQNDSLIIEEIRSPINEPEIVSIKPSKRKKAISSNVQDQQQNVETDEAFQDISPLKKTKVNQPETSILKETSAHRTQKQTRKPSRRGPKVAKSKRARKEGKAVTKTRQSRKANKKNNFHNESAESERVNNLSVESEEDVNPGDILNPQDNSVELNASGEDFSIDHDKDDKLQTSLELQNSDLEEEGTELQQASGKMLSDKQPKSRNKKKSLFKESPVAQRVSGRSLKTTQTKTVPTFHSAPPNKASLSKKNVKTKQGKGKHQLHISANAAETREESLPATPVKLKLLSALARVTPKSGISFRISRRHTSVLHNSNREEEDSDGIDNDVYSTPRSHRALGGINTPPGNGNSAILTSCMRGSSTVKNKRKGRRVTINKMVEEQEVSPRSTGRPYSSNTLASQSGLLSMSSSPVHYAEITTNETIPASSHSPRIVLPDLSHKIVPPESPPQSGLRRSKRTRVMRLNRVKGEGIIYRRDSTGFGLLVAGVQTSIVAAKIQAKEEERRRKQHRRKMQSITVPARSKKRLSAHKPLSENVTMCSEYPILDPETETEVLVECMSRKSSATWYGPDLNPVLDTDPMAVCLLIQQPSFSSGELHLRPFTEKPLGLAVQTLIYYVIFGKISVTINRVTTVAEIGDSFFIPRGNLYSLKNLRRDVAKLYFVDMGDTCDINQEKGSKSNQSSSS